MKNIQGLEAHPLLIFTLMSLILIYKSTKTIPESKNYSLLFFSVFTKHRMGKCWIKNVTQARYLETISPLCNKVCAWGVFFSWFFFPNHRESVKTFMETVMLAFSITGGGQCGCEHWHISHYKKADHPFITFAMWRIPTTTHNGVK